MVHNQFQIWILFKFFRLVRPYFKSMDAIVRRWDYKPRPMTYLKNDCWWWSVQETSVLLPTCYKVPHKCSNQSISKKETLNHYKNEQKTVHKFLYLGTQWFHEKWKMWKNSKHISSTTQMGLNIYHALA